MCICAIIIEVNEPKEVPQARPRTVCAKSHRGAEVCRQGAPFRERPPPSLTLHLSSATQLVAAFHRDQRPYSVPRPTPVHSTEGPLFVSPAFLWLLSLRFPLPLRVPVRPLTRLLSRQVRF